MEIISHAERIRSRATIRTDRDKTGLRQSARHLPWFCTRSRPCTLLTEPVIFFFFPIHFNECQNCPLRGGVPRYLPDFVITPQERMFSYIEGSRTFSSVPSFLFCFFDDMQAINERRTKVRRFSRIIDKSHRPIEEGKKKNTALLQPRSLAYE